MFKFKLNFFFFIKNFKLLNYYYYFKRFLKVHNYMFLKCCDLLTHKIFLKFINIIYSFTAINLNFFFLSYNFDFNFFWNLDLNVLSKNLNKNSFLRFLINFFKLNKIKILIFLDKKFSLFLPFFKKFNFLITCPLLIGVNPKYIDIFIITSNFYYNKYFIFNLVYKIYILSMLNKYFKYYFKYLVLKKKNFYRI